MEVCKGVRRKRTKRHEALTKRYSRGVRAGWKRAEEGLCGMHKVAEGRPCRDSLLYEQWATTRDLSWMRLMKRRMCVRAMRSKLRSTKARM